MKSLFWVLDFGFEKVIALAAEKKNDGSFSIVGAGDAPSRGVEAGEVTHLGDAAEAVVEAVRKAERSSGARAGAVYCSFDDPQALSVFSRGSRFLSGQGEIGPSDIKEASQSAARLVEHFEKSVVYSKEVRFFIDDRDSVDNPVGVFGQKLDVLVHLVQARSAYREIWHKLLKRAYLSKPVLIFSPWATAYGVLPKQDRQRKHLILDAGRDYFHFFVFEKEAITGFETLVSGGKKSQQMAPLVSEICARWLDKEPGIEQALLTGDLAQDQALVAALEKALCVPLCLSSALGIAKLHAPWFSTAAGLFYVAEELEKKVPLLQRRKDFWTYTRQKAEAFVNEYF
jgi:hypothetical protein